MCYQLHTTIEPRKKSKRTYIIKVKKKWQPTNNFKPSNNKSRPNDQRIDYRKEKKQQLKLTTKRAQANIQWTKQTTNPNKYKNKNRQIY